MKPLSMILAVAASSLAYAVAADPLPTGGVVAAGSASITTGTNSLVINQGSSRAVINWNSFNVGAANSVQFVQPGSSAATLNRVVSTDPSQILGQITANGQVFLVNPNGIFVGPAGRIDAAGIVLSTGNIADADFLAGNLRYEASPAGATIENAGQLNSATNIDIQSGGSFSPTNLGGGNLVATTSATAIVAPGGTLTLSGQAFSFSNSGTIGAASSGGTLSIQAGNLAVAASATPVLVATATPLTVTPAAAPIPTLATPVPPTQARAASSAVPPASNLNVGGLADGVVTVRMSLVDTSPITLH